jgi:hypothetical protein
LQLINVPSSRTDKPEDDAVHVPHTPESVAGQDEWGEFNHIPGRRFHDFQEIKREIENETNRIAGANKGINRQPIHLKVYSSHVLSLTLVDLPGLTKVPIGDQPTDIEKQTRNLISEYIAKPNSIILAVSPANVDIVNSEALKLARHVDPTGKRTIGVLTKLDLMDHGTNALDILAGRVYPLKLGFIGTVNRSQQDIQGNKNLSDALQAEREFFRMHPAYRNMSTRCGTQYLAKTLNSTLMTHIRERLPDIKARLNTLMGQTQQELASYGDVKFTGKEHRGSLILQLMTRFATTFISSIDGTSSEISTKELCGGARIYYIFNSVFGNSLETINPTHNLSVHDIRTAIRNSTGPRPSLFVPELAFDLLVQPGTKGSKFLPGTESVLPDVAVSAATGSGKTIAYLLPMIEALKKTSGAHERLRGLVVVPTRELVMQVAAVAESLAKGSSLKVGISSGVGRFKDEQQRLVHTGRKYDPVAYAELMKKAHRRENPPPIDSEDFDEFAEELEEWTDRQEQDSKTCYPFLKKYLRDCFSRYTSHRNNLDLICCAVNH